jgi:cysteine desulfurase / selenocysteine lyase
MLTYLNWAGLAPLTGRGYWASLFAPELLGNVLLRQWFGRVEGLRERVAEWLGCQPEQVAFVPSTSLALWVASQSLDWQVGDLVWYPAADFPANVVPWQQLGKRQVEAVAIQDWDALDLGPLNLAPKPRMLSLSTVDFTTGIEQPWQRLVRQAHAQGIWTCVDAIQSAGIKPSWQPEIDFWCAGTQKWLGSGLGLALLVVSQRVLDQLSPPCPTWLSLNQPPLLDSGWVKTARAWELGWTTPQAIARFDANLRYFQHLGWEMVTAGVKQRRDTIHERLLEMGWPVVSCPERWSGIVSFDPGAMGAKTIVEAGYRRRIILAQRGNYVRLSPHIFNSRGSIIRALDWLWQFRGCAKGEA